MIKVSIIVPVYNVEKYLSKCLDSLVNQTLKEIEIIVVNDGSPDNSKNIIEEYKKKDKRIVPIMKENGGQGSARNLGLQYAKGEYISYVDSDDWIELDMLEVMYQEAERKDFDIVICGYKNIYKDREEPCLISNYLIEDTLNNKNSKIFNTVSPWCKIYKRQFLLDSKILFAEEKVWYEDFAYSIKLLSLTDKIGIINEPFYNYFIRENSTMNNSKLLKNLDIITAFDDAISFLQSHKIYDNYYQEIEFLAIDNIFISGITRIIRAKGDRKTKKEVIHQLKAYLNLHFPHYKNNQYLRNLSKNRKIIYQLILCKQYWIISFIFKVKG